MVNCSIDGCERKGIFYVHTEKGCEIFCQKHYMEMKNESE